METLDFSNHKFRCSSLGAIMTNQPGKKDTKFLHELSATTIDELLKIYIRAKYGRDKEIKSKYMEKGLQTEEDAITLLSRVYKIPFFKNDRRVENDYLTGEADIIDPYLMDTKSCWDIHTFFKHKTEKINKHNELQIKGYCELYGFDFGRIAYCLTDMPAGLLDDEKDKLFYRMNVASRENPDYLSACEALEKELTFNDIPLEERVHQVKVERDPETMAKVYERIELCRMWLNEFANKSDLVAA